MSKKCIVALHLPARVRRASIPRYYVENWMLCGRKIVYSQRRYMCVAGHKSPGLHVIERRGRADGQSPVLPTLAWILINQSFFSVLII